MTDLELTKLCAEASFPSQRVNVGADSVFYETAPGQWTHYDPLHDDAQAMALVKKFRIHTKFSDGGIVGAYFIPKGATGIVIGENADDDLNRAIVECVAKMQAAK